MRRPSTHHPQSDTQIDPGESVDPRPSMGSDFGLHMWTTLNQISERLGGLSEKIDHLTKDQRDLRGAVDKHDKMISRAIYTVGGAVAIVLFIWFVYVNFLKGHVSIK